jgi:hypothetical protein
LEKEHGNRNITGMLKGTGAQRTVTDQRATTRQAAGEHGQGVQYARTDPRKYSFAMRSVEPWNRLPEEIKTATNSEVFRS